jgi:hypothetical protein
LDVRITDAEAKSNHEVHDKVLVAAHVLAKKEEKFEACLKQLDKQRRHFSY